MKYLIIMFVLSLQLSSCTRMEDTDLYKKLKNNEPVLIPITCHEDSSFCFLTSQKLWNKWNIKMVDKCVFDSLLYCHIKNDVYINLNMQLYSELTNVPLKLETANN